MEQCQLVPDGLGDHDLEFGTLEVVEMAQRRPWPGYIRSRSVP